MELVAGSPAYEKAYASFLEMYPAYAVSGRFDELRRTEYSRLDANGHIYLDYTGGGLYGESQLQKHIALLQAGVFGNPHSTNPSSMLSTEYVERARQAVLQYFNASQDEYIVIFTQNASGALKLLGESFPFSAGSHYLLTFDNHNSVNGIREFARAKGAQITYIPLTMPELRVDETTLDGYLDQVTPGSQNLFAFPAQSNFSGVQHPLEWIDKAHARGWWVLLDGAAFVPTNRLDLNRWRPDFVPVSFYKMFGYPTGIGCLLVRKEALGQLHRPWFAGGTITVASVQGDKYYLAPGEAAFEEGTLNYLSLPAIEIGLDYLQSVGMDGLHERVRCLTGWILEQLVASRSITSGAGARIYGPITTEQRGGTIAFNLYDEYSQPIDHRRVEAMANQANLSLRTGCFCNPGAGEIALGLSKLELLACFSQSDDRLTLDDFRVCIDGRSSGAVRVSTGIASNFSDAFRFVRFIQELTGQP